jgi:hypothetical protein
MLGAAPPEPGQRSGAWQKMRLNQAQEFVIAGYTRSAKNFDALAFGYFRGTDLIYVARTLQWLYTGIERAPV